MNQLGGINLIVYYITSVLQLNVGMTRNMSLLLGGVINIMFPLGSLYPTFTLDKTGRRKPMMWGSFGCGMSMLMVSILLSFQMRGQDDPVAKSTASASVAFFFTVSTSPFSLLFSRILINNSTCSPSAQP
jgi:MFS family permease